MPATDSFWRLANFNSITDTNPDLVIYDYTSNDISASLTFKLSKFRTITEVLVRDLYQLPKQPALIQLVLFRSLENPPDNGDMRDVMDVQKDILIPVASLYQYTLVSYKDAVWPISNKPPPPKSGIFDGIWVHPFW